MAASSAPAMSRLRRATFRQHERDMKNPKGDRKRLQGDPAIARRKTTLAGASHCARRAGAARQIFTTAIPRRSRRRSPLPQSGSGWHSEDLSTVARAASRPCNTSPLDLPRSETHRIFTVNCSVCVRPRLGGSSSRLPRDWNRFFSPPSRRRWRAPRRVPGSDCPATAHRSIARPRSPAATTPACRRMIPKAARVSDGIMRPNKWLERNRFARGAFALAPGHLHS
jgi:hypothetical protein